MTLPTRRAYDSTIRLLALSIVLAAAHAVLAEPIPCDTAVGSCWQPPLNARWQYQLEANAGPFAATGGIAVDLCVEPYTGGPCVMPDVFDIDLYVDPNVVGEGVFVPNAAGFNTIRKARSFSLFELPYLPCR